MTAEEAFTRVTDAIQAIDVSAIPGASEREGRFTLDDGDPGHPLFAERAFRFRLQSYDPPTAEQFHGCNNRHVRCMLEVLYAYTDGCQQRALRDVDPLLAALRGAKDGDLTIILTEGSTFDHAEEQPGWLMHQRVVYLQIRGT